MTKTFLHVIVLLPLMLIGCAAQNGNSMKYLETVDFVDLNRYVGQWYEIARYYHKFQKGCVGSKATYTLRDDGKITVVNECYDKTFSGKLRTAKGKSWVVDKNTNARLKVSFFWPFAGDYWIIDLGENYEYAVVGHPSRKYLWILARSRQLDEETLQQLVTTAEQLEFKTSELIFVDQ